MATVEEKLKFYEALKFTPRTYTIQMWGYGGEIVMGTVDRKHFDYFKHRRLDVSDFAWNYDYAEENNIPEENLPFEPGSWYECDDMAHCSGVNLDCGTLQITDEEGKVVLERPLEDIDGTDIQISGGDETWITQKPAGTVVFIGRSNEKGSFFEGTIHLTAPFNPEKLSITYDEVDGESYVTSVYYDDEEIDNDGANTNGKSSDFGFYLVQEGNKWETYQNHDSIEYPLTEWFPKKTNPVHVGVYLIKATDKNEYEYQARWTGTRWINSWQDDLPEIEEIKIKQWRGVTYDPDSETVPVVVQKPVAKKKVVKTELVKNTAWPF